MPAVIPSRLIDVPDYGQVIGAEGTPVTVGPWLALTNPANPNAGPCYRMIDGAPTRVDPHQPVAQVVPSHNDAILNIIQGGFTILGAE